MERRSTIQHTLKSFSILIAAALLAVPAAIAAEYEFVTLDNPGPGALANDINNRGQIVGRDGGIGFLLDGDVLTPIAFPGADTTNAFGINDQGTIVGQFVTGGDRHGFILDKGVFTQVDYPPGLGNSYAFGINNQGDIIGLWCDERDTPPCAFSPGAAGDAFRGWLLNKDGFAGIDAPGAVDTFSLRLNDQGAIAGQFYTAVTGFAFERDRDGAYRTIVVPGATESEAHGINNQGETAGLYFDAGGNIIGFLEEKDGGIADIEFPGASGTIVLGFNDVGDVVGAYFDDDFNLIPFAGFRQGQP